MGAQRTSMTSPADKRQDLRDYEAHRHALYVHQHPLYNCGGKGHGSNAREVQWCHDCTPHQHRHDPNECATCMALITLGRDTELALAEEARDTPHLDRDGDRWRDRHGPAVTDDGPQSESRSSGGWQGGPSGQLVSAWTTLHKGFSPPSSWNWPP